MKISRKITLTIVLTLLLLLGVGYVGLHYVVGNKFGELERMSVERNRERVRAVVQAELGQLTMLGQDWSEWDETYAYMVSRDPAYLAANLNVRTFETLGVDLVALYDADKQPQAAFAYHGGQLVTQTPAQLAPLTDYLVRYGSLKPNAGIWFDGERYYLLAATQILTSEGEGPSRGTLLLLKAFTTRLVHQLQKRTNLSLSFLSRQQLATSLGVTTLARLRANDSLILPQEERLLTLAQIDTLQEDSPLIFRFTLPRDLMLEGKAIERHIFWLLSLGTLLFGALVLLILNGYIAARLQRLSANLRLIGDDGAVRRLLVEGNDEISQVAIDCNRMLDHLDSLRQRQLDSEARQKLQHGALIHLAKSDLLSGEDPGQAARHINEAICSGTGAARASVWFSAEDKQSMCCQDLFFLPKLHHQQGFHLPYALIQGRYEVSKPEHEPCLILREPYDLTRFGAMLAQLGLEGLSGTILMAPLKQGDELLGFIIAERARLSEVWHPDELAFVLSVCDLSAQTLLTLTKLQRLKRS